MKPQGLLIAVVVLVGLSGLVWWSNKKQATTKPADNTVKILSIPDDQFQDIQIKNLVGQTLDLAKQNGKWAITAPQAYPADQDGVASIVSTLSALNADKTVVDKDADLHAYGLDIPTLDVTVTRKDGKKDEVLIGNATLDNSGYYAKLPSDPRVFTVGSDAKTALDKTADILRDKSLLTFDPDKLTRVALNVKGDNIEFGKNGQGDWEIVKPRPLRADSSAVSGLVDKLKDAKFDNTETAEDAAKKFAGAAKIATVTVTDSAGSQTLEIRQDKDKNYYAKSSVVQGEWKTSSDTGDALAKGLDDYRNKKLYDFGFNDPSKIELKNATYVKSGDKWLNGAKTMDSASVQAVIDKLRDLTATKFSDKGGGSEVFEAGVTWNGGKKVDKVVITKQGSDYFATRVGGPSIYVLDATAVDDLQKAAAGVVEALPEKKK
ncbi:MAG TPA: DUF4340 domain-containing protein [Bryobacteraceae bacterium]|nr:DUF4340 domain-containing protein [Bryobacteraceae bacterium]